jgi:hypothetical protein
VLCKWNFQSQSLRFLPQSSSDTVASDTNCLYCRVVEVRRTNRYRLATKFGVLTAHYLAGELLRVSLEAALAVDILEFASTISLHEAAAKISTGAQVGISCNGKPPRCSGRCRCIKNNVKCSGHCHSSEFNCANLSSLLQQMEIALVPRQPDSEAQIQLEVQAIAARTGRKRAATSTVITNLGVQSVLQIGVVVF